MPFEREFPIEKYPQPSDIRFGRIFGNSQRARKKHNWKESKWTGGYISHMINYVSRGYPNIHQKKKTEESNEHITYIHILENTMP